MRDLLNWGMIESGKRPVDVNEESVSCQKTNGNGKFGNLHLEQVLGLEEDFVDFFVLVDYALLFSR